MLLHVHRNRRFIRDREPRTSTSTFTQLLSSGVVIEVLLYVYRNRRFIRDGEPRTSSSTFTQLLSSVSRPVVGCGIWFLCPLGSVRFRMGEWAHSTH